MIMSIFCNMELQMIQRPYENCSEYYKSKEWEDVYNKGFEG